MRRIFLLLFVLCSNQYLLSQPAKSLEAGALEIEFNLDNARQTLELLGKTTLTEAELQHWVNLPGTKALIAKVRSTPDTAISALKRTMSGKPLTNQERNFQFDFILKNYGGMQSFINQLSGRQDSILNSLKENLSRYLPAGKKARITLYGLLGGYSAGFAFTNDPAAFYMGLHQYKNDIIGVALSARHELFHTLQTVAYPYKPVMERLRVADSTLEAPYFLLTHLFLEGSAEYISDGKDYLATSPFLKNEYDHASVNHYRQEANFYLIERMVLDAANHYDQMNFDHLYSILFDWNWNNPAYYTGKVMITELVKKHGAAYLNKCLQRDALFFVKDYIQLRRTEKREDLYEFSATFELLLDKMIRLSSSD